MKTIIFAFLSFMAIAFAASAQFTAGTKQLGGTITAFQDKSENEFAPGNTFGSDERTYREIGFNTNMGFFIADNTSVGFGLGYSNILDRTVFDSREFELTTNAVTISLFSRLHKPLTDNFLLFLQPILSTSLGRVVDNGDSNDPDEDIFAFGISVSPGLIFMLNKNFGI